MLPSHVNSTSEAPKLAQYAGIHPENLILDMHVTLAIKLNTGYSPAYPTPLDDINDTGHIVTSRLGPFLELNQLCYETPHRCVLQSCIYEEPSAVC